jgi:hypothetical protein
MNSGSPGFRASTCSYTFVMYEFLKAILFSFDKSHALTNASFAPAPEGYTPRNEKNAMLHYKQKRII